MMKRWIIDFWKRKNLFGLKSFWPEGLLLLGTLSVVILPMSTLAANRKNFSEFVNQSSDRFGKTSTIPAEDSVAFQRKEVPDFRKDSLSFLFPYTFLERKTPTTQKVKISSYDSLFIKGAEKLSWDWTILAAIAKLESGFRPSVRGGLMGIIPATARRFGYSRTQIKNPKNAVDASVRCIQSLEKYFSAIPDFHDKMLFIIASYVSGPGHITDAQKVAEYYGANPLKWEEVVPYILKMSEKKYYSTQGIRYGSFNGKHTINYITKLLKHAQSYADEVWATE